MLWRRCMSESLKQRLDAVWNSPEIASPNHLNRWNEKGNGYSRFGALMLYWQHGTPRKPKGKRPKGKGFSFLPESYGLYWRIHEQKSLRFSLRPFPRW